MAESSMSTDQKISLMQDLFGLCDNVFTWCYDANGTMLTTNCPDQTVLDTAFSAFGIKNRLLAAAEGGRPVLLGTAIGLVYGADFEHDAQGSLRRCWLLGPVFYSTVSMGQLELGYGNYQGLELSLAWKEQFMQAAARLPVVSNVLLGRHLLMLHFGLTGERLNISDLLLPSEDLHPLPERSAPERDRYQVYAAERALLGMVRNGDMNYQEALSHSISVSSGVRVSGPDPLRQAKTSCIVFTSLVCRAAIEGGLSPEEAYSLGDAYIQSVENARTQESLLHLPATMYADFIRRVHRCRTNPRYSTAIQKCVDYIEQNLSDKIQAADLARAVGYDEYYLTRRFKKETGLSVTNYVKFAKIERAKVLLDSTKMSVQAVADALGFTTRSYFIQCFRAVTGQTPTEWRGK